MASGSQQAKDEGNPRGGESGNPARLISDNASLPAPKKVDRLADYKALLPLAILSIAGGAWLKVHAKGVVELSGVVIATLGAAGYLLRFLPDGTWKSGLLELGKSLKSEKLRNVAWGAVAALVLVMAFFSSVHVSAKEDRTPITVFRMNGDPDAPPDVRAQIELTRAKPSNSFLVPILPLGRPQWLRTSAEDRTAPFRLYPIFPRQLRYPDDFPPAFSVILLPTGSFFGDLGNRPRLIVRADSGRGDTLAVDSLVKIEALVLSIGKPVLDTVALRPQWVKTLRDALSTPPAEAEMQLQVNDWMRPRAVRTTRAFRKDEQVGIVVLSRAGDTLAVAGVTLTTPLSDVILHRP